MNALRPLFNKASPTALKHFAAHLLHLIETGVISEANAANDFYWLTTVTDTGDVLGSEIYSIDEWFEPWAFGSIEAATMVRKHLEQFRSFTLSLPGMQTDTERK
jgi:hypothetical protein